MSDTPRTNNYDWSFHLLFAEAQKMERELNAANDRIKRLEEDLMDAKNQYAVLVADVVLYEDRGERIKRLAQAGDCLLSHRNSTDYHEKVREWDKAKKDKP